MILSPWECLWWYRFMLCPATAQLPYVPVLLHPGLNRTPRLSNVDQTTQAKDAPCLHPCPFPSAIHIALKIWAIGSSETLVSYCNTARRHNSEDVNLNLHRRENLKSLNRLKTEYWSWINLWFSFEFYSHQYPSFCQETIILYMEQQNVKAVEGKHRRASEMRPRS